MKNKIQNPLIWHLIAVVIVAIWGTTFISTKVLIHHGLRPEEIFFLRFTIAYIGIWLVSPHKLFADSWRDEGQLLIAGIMGGSAYFLTENTALGITLATNVSFIVCTAPLLTILLLLLLKKSHPTLKPLFIGSALALVGVALVVFNGSFVLKISPLGDLLSFTAALTWAFYTLSVNGMMKKYDGVFVTRKVFFYGLLTILSVFLFRPWSFPLAGLLETVVAGNLLFLGVLASLLCYAVWNVVIDKLGSIESSNYIYLNPIFTLIGSALFLDEKLTWLAFVGIAFILIGVAWAARAKKESQNS